MKFFSNLVNGFRMFRSIGVFNNLFRDIDEIRQSSDLEKERELIASSTAVWVNSVMDIFDMTFDIEGRENIPEGPCVFISNHQGYADILIMIKACEGKQVGFIAKENLEKLPYFGKWIKAIRGVFIKRGDARESLKSIKEGVDLLKQGFSLVIFPEGTRSKGKDMAEFKAGSFKLATKAKVPVVPVAIQGTYRMFEDDGVIKHGTHSYARILEPFDTAAMDRKELANLHTKVEDIIRENLEDLRKNDPQYKPL